MKLLGIVSKTDISGKSKEQIVTEILHNIGFRRSDCGFDYARQAILMCIDNPRLMYSICELYRNVAAKLDKTGPRVERGIRNQLQRCYKVDRPTPGQFIATIADDLRLKIGGSCGGN